MRYTITHLRAWLSSLPAIVLILVSISSDARAQTSAAPADDPFAANRWHAEFSTQAALEAWNYNGSHEELYGLVQGVTYGLHRGLMLTVRQRLYYVSQRRNDSRILGLTSGLRGRLYHRGVASAFWQFDLGISDAAVAAPPRGTRFNYLALGGPGMLVQLTRRLSLATTLEVVHISNASLKGPDRNPDIEAIGASVGMIVALN